MPEQVRVDTAAVHTMASGWGALVSELNGSAGPAGLGLSWQASAAAVTVAHAATAAFTQALAAQVQSRASQVVDADTSYLANEASSANELGGL